MSNPFSCNPFGGGGGAAPSGAAFDGEFISAVDNGSHTITSNKIHTLTIASDSGLDLSNFTLTFAPTGGEGQLITVYANQIINPMTVVNVAQGAWTSMAAGEAYQVVVTGYGVVRVV